jgi:hypothetical protein
MKEYFSYVARLLIQHKCNVSSGQLQVEQGFIGPHDVVQIVKGIYLTRRITSHRSWRKVHSVLNIKSLVEVQRNGCPIL